MDQLQAEHQKTFEKLPQNDEEPRGINESSQQSIQQSIQQPNPIAKSNQQLYLIIPMLILLIMVIFVYKLKAKVQQSGQILKNIQVNNLSEISNNLTKQMNEQTKLIDEYENKSKTLLQRTKLESDLIFERSKEEHYNERIRITKDIAEYDRFLLKNHQNARIPFRNSMKNIKLMHQNIHIRHQIEQNQRILLQRLQKTYNFKIPQQPICVIVPTKNNRQKFKFEYVLQSVFIQDYTNFKIVVIDDSTQEQTLQLFKQYAKQTPIKQIIYYVKDKVKGNTLSYIYSAVTQYCSPDDIAIILEGSGQLLGKFVFKVFNSVYDLKKVSVLYSNSIIYNITTQSVLAGSSSAYTPQEKTNNQYRFQYTRMGPLRSFKVKAFLDIPVAGLKDQSGNFFNQGYEQILYPQMLELSCQKNEFLNEFAYVVEVDGKKKQPTSQETKQKISSTILRKKKRHTCKI